MAGSLTKEKLCALLHRKTWSAICNHAKTTTGTSMPDGIMTLSAAAKKSGYNRQTLMRMLRANDKKVFQRTGRSVGIVRPQMVVVWADVLEAIKINNEYVTASLLAASLKTTRVTLVPLLREMGLIQDKTQAGKAILIHVAHVDVIRIKLASRKARRVEYVESP